MVDQVSSGLVDPGTRNELKIEKERKKETVALTVLGPYELKLKVS